MCLCQFTFPQQYFKTHAFKYSCPDLFINFVTICQSNGGENTVLLF